MDVKLFIPQWQECADCCRTIQANRAGFQCRSKIEQGAIIADIKPGALNDMGGFMKIYSIDHIDDRSVAILLYQVGNRFFPVPISQ